MSIVVWVLVINFYAKTNPEIQFKTEQECETAREGIINPRLKLHAICEPRKAK